MTTVLERVPLDQISRQARDVRFGRVLLTIIAAVLFGIGWVAARALGGLWLAIAWSVTAIRVGWQAGAAHGGPARTDR